MKRILALALAATMLLSLFVAPVAAVETAGDISYESAPTISLTATTFETANQFIRAKDVVTDFKIASNQDNLIALKVSAKNNASDKDMYWAGEQLFIKYDETAFELYKTSYNDPLMGTVEVGPIAPEVPADNGGIYCNPAKWSDGNNLTVSGLVQFTSVSGEDQKLIAKDQTVTLAYILFKVKAGAENGTYRFEFDTTKDNAFLATDKNATLSSVVTGVDFDSVHADVTLTGGALPTLDSVSMKADDEGGLDAVYGQTKNYTLKAFSTKGGNVSDSVTWKVEPSTGVTIDNNTNTLTVSGLAAVGTYTVTAMPDTTKCNEGTDVQPATFNVTKAPVTSVNVTISNFAKGLEIKNASAAVTEPADAVDVQILGWYVGQGTETAVTETHFKANTTYTAKLKLTLKDSTNYEFKDVKATVKMDDTTTVNPSISAEGIAEATATTAQRTKLAVNIAPVSRVAYGTLLKDVTIGSDKAGKIVVAGTTNEVKGTYVWDTSYASDEKVGDVIYPSSEHLNGRAFKAKFIPTESEIYETLELNAYVIVTECPISISSITALTQNTFEYDGNDHTVALDVSGISADLANQLSIDYVGDVTKKDVGNYEVTATIGVADPAHYMISDTNKTRTLSWRITPGTLTPDSEQTKEVLYGSAQTVTITPQTLGLPAGETFNVEIVDPTMRDPVTSYTVEGDVGTGNVAFALRETSVPSDIGKKAEYTLKYTSTNYNAVQVKLIIKIIDKTILTNDPMTVKVDNAEYGVGVTPVVSGQPANTSSLKYEYINTELGASPKYDETSIKNAPVGKYELTVSCYNDTTIYKAIANFEITPRDISKKDVATVTFDKSLTYNGNQQTQTMTVKVDNTPLTLGMDYELDTENGASLTQKDAGSYTVIIKGKGNYTGTLLAAFTIAKATPAATDFTFTAPENLVYDGNPKTATVSTANTEIGAVTVSYDPAVPTNAGKYKVKISTAETKNYKPVTDLTADGWKFTIAPKPVTVTDIAAQDKTYDGTDTATITGTLTGVLEKDKANVTLNAPTATFASKNVNAQAIGTQKALPQAVTVAEGSKFTLSGSAADNYEISPEPDLTNLTATINFKTLALTEAQRNLTVDVRYTDLTEHSVSLPVPEGLIEGDVVTNVRISKSSDPYPYNRIEEPTYNSENGSIKFRLASETEETASVKYLISLNYGSNYYNTLNLTLYINISIRSAQSPLTYTGATSVVYGQSITLTSAGGSGTGAVTYAIVSGGDGAATISGNVLTATKAGTVKIQVTKAGDNDYLSTTSAVYDITVTKATPATPPEIKVDNTDTTLGELGNKMLDEIDVPGTIHWNGPDGKPITKPHNTKIEANTEYSWTFVPADSTNYNEIRGTTTPYVRDDLSWLPGVLGGGSSFSFHDVTRFDYYYDSVKWAADNGIASGTSRFAFSPDAVCTRAQTVTFLWRAAGSPLPRYRVSPFTDVHSYDYYYEAVLWAVEQGITTGLTATTFGPDETVTRGQVATFLYRAASAAKPNTFNPFTDVKPTAYNYGAILWAYDNRITTGTSTTTFSPDAFCTRAQIVTFLYRYYQGR